MISATGIINSSGKGPHSFLVAAARQSLEQWARADLEARKRLLIMNPNGTTECVEHFDLFVGQEFRRMSISARFVSIERPKDKVLIEKGILLTFFSLLLAFPVLSLLTLALIGLTWLKQETHVNPIVIPREQPKSQDGFEEILLI